MLKLKTKLGSLKDWFKSCSLKKKLSLAGGFLTILVLIYLLVAGLAVSPAEIQLAELKNSWEKEKICHEACAGERAQAEEMVVKALKKTARQKETHLARRLKIYFLDENLSAEFRSELVKIWQRAFGPDNPPDYLKDYLASAGGNTAVQAAIIASFPVAFLTPISVGHSPLDYYFTLLTGNRDLALKQAAVSALSNYPDKTRDFSEDQLATIKNLALNPATDRRLRQPLILLLADYYSLFPETTAAVLKTVYEAESAGDEISRAFAADIFNKWHSGADKLPVSAVSDAAWEKYYNN